MEYYASNIYDVMRDEADQQADYDKDIQVYASDIDPEMVEIAKRNAEEVGLGDIIQFSVKDVNTLTIDQEGPVALVGNRHTASVLEVELKLKKCIDM